MTLDIPNPPDELKLGDASKASAWIRKTLKGLGYSARDVSVRTSKYSLGSSIRIEIKTARTPRALVEAVAGKLERVSRCSMSGEILSGGNRFVFVDYGAELLRRVREAVSADLAKLSPGEVIAYRTADDGIEARRMGEGRTAFSVAELGIEAGSVYAIDTAANVIAYWVLTANALDALDRPQAPAPTFDSAGQGLLAF
jgi:hypothetical protein